MKRNSLWMTITLGSALFLAACGTQNEQDSAETEEMMQPVEVELTTEPGKDELKDGEAFTIQAKVTQGEENVDDAKEVEFEFWKEGEESDDHEMIEGESQGEGIYSIEKTVEEAGIYYVISHVTARDMHTMPKLELTIGDVEKTEHAHEEEGHDHGDGHGEEATGHLMVPDTVKKEEEFDLTGHAKHGEEPLTEAQVRFEIWKDGEEKHEFIDTSEEGEGEYKASHMFSEAGTYHVKLHIEKGELHTHTEKTVTVE
ncbi:FixH family protein [Bacillus salacetis]|uniref:FixH family protein n=1 Tax=Bacillus salacetis TaxID=2315464 RepID=UPI003BA3325A